MSSPKFPWLDETRQITFPDPRKASREGLVCTEGNLSPGVLLSAYSQGLFPWYSDGDPILWWSPDPRFVLYPEKLHISRSMHKLFRKNPRPFLVSVDTDFEGVIRSCASANRRGETGTWITDEMIEAYVRLHHLGFAHSVEVSSQENPGELCGGLYGISLGSIFFGESMFSLRPNASKFGFLLFASMLRGKGFRLIDSQMHTRHLESLGGEKISRDRYLDELSAALKEITLQGSWDTLFSGIGEFIPAI